MRFSLTLVAVIFLLAPLAWAGPTGIDIDHQWTLSVFGGRFGLVQVRVWELDLTGQPPQPDVITLVHCGRSSFQTSFHASTIAALGATAVILIGSLAFFRQRWKGFHYGRDA